MNVNVIMRYFLSSSWTPTEEVCLILIVIVTFMGSAHATRVGLHLFASLVFDLPIVPVKCKKALAILISVVCTGLCLLLAVLAAEVVKQNYTSGRTTPSLGIPFFVFYTVLPVSFLLMAWHNARTILANVKNKEFSLSPDKEDPASC